MLKYRLPLPQNVIVFGDRAFKEVVELNESIRVGEPYLSKTGVLLGKGNLDTQRGTCPQRKDHVRTQGEGGFCKPSREASEETSPAHTRSSSCQPPELSDNTFLLFKSPGLWYFVMANMSNWPRDMVPVYS